MVSVIKHSLCCLVSARCVNRQQLRRVMIFQLVPLSPSVPKVNKHTLNSVVVNVIVVLNGSIVS